MHPRIIHSAVIVALPFLASEITKKKMEIEAWRKSFGELCSEIIEYRLIFVF